uniref:hypothetical protein n=1 Tax=Gemmiger formicilis TaxID=745368 RepID=UPI004028E3C7
RPDGRTTPRISRNDYITASRPECQEYCQKNLEKIVQYGEFFISEAKCANLAPVWAAASHFGKSAHRMKRTVSPRRRAVSCRLWAFCLFTRDKYTFCTKTSRQIHELDESISVALCTPLCYNEDTDKTGTVPAMQVLTLHF